MTDRTVSVVVPVLNGERYLAQVLEAVRSQGDVELLVIDSGSTDASREIARLYEAIVVEVAPEAFGHGRTRNRGAELTSGELICFLTQDAVPVPGWLAAYREAFNLAPRVGAAFGPHLPRAETSPMVARDLEQWFGALAPNGDPVLHQRGSSPFLSNVNACYLRSCWEEIRFRDLAYAEDQAFGADMLERGWTKVFHPGAAVHHAHDYPTPTFFRRYFDEYRGLREAIGHREGARPLAAVREVARSVAADRAWMREREWPARARAGWTIRSVGHHSARKLGAVLGTRADLLPCSVERALSLEGRARRAGPRRGRSVPRPPAAGVAEDVARVEREGVVPLAEVVRGDRDGPLHCAFVIPPFGRGSGGHGTIFQIVRRLERRGHTCSIWVYDPLGTYVRQPAPVLRRRILDWYGPVAAPVFLGTSQWFGADVAIATGWDTVYATLLLADCGARAYLINDHEPEFFPTSAEAIWAADTYRRGLYGISASRWLRDLLFERYGQRGTWFRLGVDTATYHPRDVERRRDIVAVYGRASTPRRAVPLALAAAAELRRRRPGVRVVLFGEGEPPSGPVGYESVGLLPPRALAELYSEATVGLCLSLTNYSLVPQEMMACGLPCVDVAGGSAAAEFGADGGVEVAAPQATALADAMERLIVDEELWLRRSLAGIAHGATASWDVAAEQVEQGLREALRARAGSADRLAGDDLEPVEPPPAEALPRSGLREDEP
jgi:glycosyltransferase involved in cell wall biosynthesis